MRAVWIVLVIFGLVVFGFVVIRMRFRDAREQRALIESGQAPEPPIRTITRWFRTRR